jgi:hypothetical protein
MATLFLSMLWCVLLVSQSVALESAPEVVNVTPSCAAVLLVGGGVAGAAVAATVLPAVMYIAGFSQGGVLAGSFAASWQSTMPFVAQGSLFAALQSAAAGGVGSTVVISAASVGSTSSVLLLQQACSAIDSVPAGSIGQALVLAIYKCYKQCESLSLATREDMQNVWKTAIENATPAVAATANMAQNVHQFMASGDVWKRSAQAVQDARRVATQAATQAATLEEYAKKYIGKAMMYDPEASVHKMVAKIKKQGDAVMSRGRKIYGHVFKGF